MLQELHIANFALIDRLDLTFGPALNILTGETGAGKSIIIDALGLTLGERASAAEAVRTGADKALVEAVFSLSGVPPEVLQRLEEADLLSEEEDLLLVSREITRSGKSSCRINGRLVPLAVLRGITDSLVDVHGQHEHQALLQADRHVDLLDQWCGPDALALRTEVAERLSALNALRRERDLLQTDARERARTLDLYRFQQEEITAAHLQVGEEEELVTERSRLANAEKLSAAAQEGYEALSGGDGAAGALDALNSAFAAVQHAVGLDETLTPILEALTGAISFTEDAGHSLRDYQEQVEFNPERLEEIETRLQLLRTLKRKYGETVQEIIDYGCELTEKLDRLENAEVRGDELTAEINRAERALTERAQKLTLARQAAALDFAPRIMTELTDLGMAATRFEVSLEPHAMTARGADKVEFLLSPNPGEPLRPLARIASGGEMSRIMLAMKSVLIRSGGTQTMIFDEVDVGVGGRTAQTIADKLDHLADQAQLLCITHLPQIASRADDHFAIEKSVSGGRTTVTVHHLTKEEQVEEIARMLGGTRRTEAVVQHAREMLSVS